MQNKAIRILNKKTVLEAVRRAVENASGEWTEDQIKDTVRDAFKPSAEDLNFLFRMRDAEVRHLKTRRQHVADNALKIAASAHEETRRIDQVVKEMKEKNLKTAGEALVSLGYVEKEVVLA